MTNDVIEYDMIIDRIAKKFAEISDYMGSHELTVNEKKHIIFKLYRLLDDLEVVKNALLAGPGDDGTQSGSGHSTGSGNHLDSQRPEGD